MAQINNFGEARRVLAGFMPSGAPTKPYTLERMRRLMDALGNPQNAYKTIHVAGTSGKTSTSYYIAALLAQTGKKVGLTVSPHVDEVNERVQINLRPMPEKDFGKGLTEFLDIITRTGLRPSYFELLVAFAYWEFARQKCDYAVAEVGLGGLLDGTNVISREDKVCVITDIGYDHTEVLGKTLPEIATQKAGIITSHNAVFTFEQDKEVMSVVRNTCKENHGQLFAVQNKSYQPIQNLPLFQQHNFQLAKETVDYVLNRDNLEPLTAAQLGASMTTHIPARMEIVNLQGKTLIIDGSHNAQKIQTLGKSIAARFPDKKIAALASFVSGGHDTKGAVQEVLGIADFLIITSFSGEQDTPKHSVNPQEIAAVCENLGSKNYLVIKDPQHAYKELLKRPEPVLLVTGSFYLLNHIRPLVFKSAPPAHQQS